MLESPPPDMTVVDAAKFAAAKDLMLRFMPQLGKVVFFMRLENMNILPCIASLDLANHLAKQQLIEAEDEYIEEQIDSLIGTSWICDVVLDLLDEDLPRKLAKQVFDTREEMIKAAANYVKNNDELYKIISNEARKDIEARMKFDREWGV